MHARMCPSILKETVSQTSHYNVSNKIKKTKNLLQLVTEPSVPMLHAFGMSSPSTSRLLIVSKTLRQLKTLLFRKEFDYILDK